MVHASLFSGIGGFDLAAEIVGWENAFSCEIDPFCNRVLKFHFPHETQYNDIRRADFSVWRGRIDVLSGGFPCQPFSQAGKRKGTDDDRHLWPAMLGAIRTIRPRWVVGENVLGIVTWNAGMVFEQVCADLEVEGYQVQPFVLPACGVDAPHRRYRTFFIAYRHDDQRESGVTVDKQRGKTPTADGRHDDAHAYGTGFQTQGAEQSAAGASGVCTGPASDAERGGGNEMGTDIQSEQSDGQEPVGAGGQRYAPDAESGGRDGRRTDRVGPDGNPSQRSHFFHQPARPCQEQSTSDTIIDGNQSCGEDTATQGERRSDDGQPEERREPSERTDGLYDVPRPASDSGGEQLQERSPHGITPHREEDGAGLDGRPERSGDPKATPDPGNKGLERNIDSREQVSAWTVAQEGIWPSGQDSSFWREFPTQSPICGRDDGFSDWLDPAAVFAGAAPSKRAIPFNRWRSESIKAYGNAVVVPLIVQIFRAIHLYETLYG